MITACNVKYAAHNDGIAVKTKISAHAGLGDWETKKMIPEDPYIDLWARPYIDEWMQR